MEARRWSQPQLGKKVRLRGTRDPKEPEKGVPRATKNGPCKERTNQHTFGTDAGVVGPLDSRIR